MNLKKTIFFSKINNLMQKKKINYILLDYNYFFLTFPSNLDLIYLKLNIQKFKIKKNYSKLFFILDDNTNKLINNNLLLLVTLNLNNFFFFIYILYLLNDNFLSVIINIKKNLNISEKKIITFFTNNKIKLKNFILQKKNNVLKKKFFFNILKIYYRLFMINLNMIFLRKFKILTNINKIHANI